MNEGAYKPKETVSVDELLGLLSPPERSTEDPFAHQLAPQSTSASYREMWQGVSLKPAVIATVRQMGTVAPLTNQSVREELSLTRDEALEVLRVLTRDGYVERRGSKRGTHYVLRNHEALEGRRLNLSPTPAPSIPKLAEVRNDFDMRVRAATNRASALLGEWYVARLERLGPLSFAQETLQREKPLRSLKRLHREGMLESSIEAIAIDPAYSHLFSDVEIKTARLRLLELGAVRRGHNG
ncbi:hypothetical protein [Geodermatophilus dictyosporus]|uniref:hypothetical protein n=1 Tax=Geodermatophilus dictyosporus TaxID=1523247 RepID=UPI0010AA59CD|nr:hypothetical protein [Geodermatophilus dictyosporus]